MKNDNPFTLSFTLRQHTPIIHFQYDQPGATLRATEVKPKLDDFLLKILGEKDLKKGVSMAKEKHYLIGEEKHHALNYKMHISTPP